MRAKVLLKLLYRLTQNIPCPKCKQVFSDPNMEVQFTSKTHLNARANCPACSAKVQLSTLFSKENKTTGKASIRVSEERMNEETQNISATDIIEIKQTLKHFSGENMKDLFTDTNPS